MKLIDANILLYSVNSTAPEHLICRTWLDDALNGQEEIAFDWIALMAFLRLSTQAKTFAQPLSVPEAIQRVNDWLQAPVARVVTPKPDHWIILRGLLAGVGTGGNLTTDAHLAAIAISHGATLVSNDKDFRRFPGLKWENPLQP